MSAQLPMRFNGPAYVPAVDGERLTKQHEVIRDFMLDGQWHTLPEIEAATGFPQASISAQLRHLRKERFGAFTIDKERVTGGLWQYRLKR
jgi:hypothetical protein